MVIKLVIQIELDGYLTGDSDRIGSEIKQTPKISKSRNLSNPSISPSKGLHKSVRCCFWPKFWSRTTPI